VFLNNLRQVETKSLITNKYSVYDSLILVKGRKHLIVVTPRKKDSAISNNFSHIIAYPSNISKDSKVIFQRYDVSYLVKKLLFKSLTNNFINLKSFLVKQLDSKKIYNFKSLASRISIRSKNYVYKKGKLVFLLGRSFFLPSTFGSYINKKLPFKVFKFFVKIKTTLRKFFIILYNLYKLQKFFSVNFVKALQIRFLAGCFLLPIFFKKLEKSINILAKAAFTRHKFEVMKRFSFLSYIVKNKYNIIYSRLIGSIYPFAIITFLAKRFILRNLLKIENLIIVKLFSFKRNVILATFFNSFVSLIYNVSFNNFTIATVSENFRNIYIKIILKKNYFLISKRYLVYALRRAWLKLLRKISFTYSFYRYLPSLGGNYAIFNLRNRLLKINVTRKNVSRIGQLLSNSKRLKQMGVTMHNFWKLYRFNGKSFTKFLLKLRVISKKKLFTLIKLNKLIIPYAYNNKFSNRKSFNFKKAYPFTKPKFYNIKKVYNKNLYRKNFRHATIG